MDKVADITAQDAPDMTAEVEAGVTPTPATKQKQAKVRSSAKTVKETNSGTTKSASEKVVKPAAPNVRTAKPAAAPWTFPKNTLEDAIKIARAIEEQNGGNPMKPDILAKAVGYNSVSDWRFLDLLRSANQYGLVTGSGKISPVGLTEIGQDVVAPSAPSARPKALMAAFRSVENFREG